SGCQCISITKIICRQYISKSKCDSFNKIKLPVQAKSGFAYPEVISRTQGIVVYTDNNGIIGSVFLYSLCIFIGHIVILLIVENENICFIIFLQFFSKGAQ